MKLKLLAALLLAAGVSANAKVSLPGIISDNMVLQQNSETALWGKAEAGAKVAVKAGWLDKSLETYADKDGKWKIRISVPDAGGPYSIEFNDGESTVIENVLIGEVWLCSGQSNMEMPMAGFQTQPVEGALERIINAAPDTPIRMCTIPRATADSPAEDCDTGWKENTPENVAWTSATAYYFASKLQAVLDIPVGIIVSSWGGTPIRAWIDEETLEACREDLAVQPELWMKSTLLFNGMIAPLTSYNVRGMIWYQGETDIPYGDMYRKVQPAFVDMIRRYWENPDMPFYYVQLAPHNYSDPMDTGAALIREAQMLNLGDIPNSGMAVTMDAGDPVCIHPSKKETAGNRLAYLALSKTYGIKGFEAEPPVYESWSCEDGRIIVTFKVGNQGLAPLGQILEGFEVAGEDNVFHPATAKILGSDGGRTIEVFCDKVKNPAAVRYGFRNFAEATLFNNFGIPASPFRTDSPDSMK